MEPRTGQAGGRGPEAHAVSLVPSRPATALGASCKSRRGARKCTACSSPMRPSSEPRRGQSSIQRSREKQCAVCFAEWLLAARARPRGPPGRPPVGLSRYYGRAQKTKKQAWVVQKAAGTYEHDDLPGACFRCGGFGHLAIDCPMQASSGSSGDNPGRAGVICPRCGAARKCQGDAFCSHCGSPF